MANKKSKPIDPRDEFGEYAEWVLTIFEQTYAKLGLRGWDKRHKVKTLKGLVGYFVYWNHS